MCLQRISFGKVQFDAVGDDLLQCPWPSELGLTPAAELDLQM